ncbi:glycosyltransferase [Corynebacterium kutscheri]|uniref:glycosyltransferase family 4 protein n=1 Tax=Corynebacterium kutscheri TaxID=35755 RepID=UPI000F6BC86C|nr:glycosyltransferase family 1 protein [Corynebacterium kutscheri]VEH80623.1 glycosyltransferase [Corynebacterium kutscheri]
MRIAIVAESFLPEINGVSNSVARILDYAADHGHEVIIIAPGKAMNKRTRDDRKNDEVTAHTPQSYAGFPIIRVPSIYPPLIDSFAVGVPTRTLSKALTNFRPDIVHLASPFVLGGVASFIARCKKIPTVAVYQTDIAGFANRYHLSQCATASWWWTRMVHNNCQRTLAPSRTSMLELRRRGIKNLYCWARGVDTMLFHPDNGDQKLRLAWDPTGKKTIVGYVGRLAAEKGVHRLRVLEQRRDMQLIIVGDGPERKQLATLLPSAIFLGARTGKELSRIYASFDVFVHPGEFETFCQTIQEAHASGVSTIAPRAGGPIDLINSDNGLLLDLEHFETDLVAAVDKLRGLSSDSVRQTVLGKTWPAVCEQLFEHYRCVQDS